MRPPETNLAPSSEPWGRWLNEAVAGVQGSLDREAQNQNSAGSQFNARMDQMARIVESIGARRIQRVDMGDLFLAIPPGTPGTPVEQKWGLNISAPGASTRNRAGSVLFKVADRSDTNTFFGSRIRVTVNGNDVISIVSSVSPPPDPLGGDSIFSTIGFSDFEELNLVELIMTGTQAPFSTEYGWWDVQVAVIWNEAS